MKVLLGEFIWKNFEVGRISYTAGQTVETKNEENEDMWSGGGREEGRATPRPRRLRVVVFLRPKPDPTFPLFHPLPLRL